MSSDHIRLSTAGLLGMFSESSHLICQRHSVCQVGFQSNEVCAVEALWREILGCSVWQYWVILGATFHDQNEF